MQLIWEKMTAAFNGIRESGGYFLFYLLALGLGLIVAWNRYGNGKTGDNWMVEEAKKKIQLWPFLFGLLSLLLLVGNPISIFIWNKISPMEGNMEKLWSLLLMLFLIAYGLVCFISLLGEQKQKNIVVVGFALLIGLAGSSYGLLSERNGEEVYESQRQAEAALYDSYKDMGTGTGTRLLAPASFLEYAAVYSKEHTPLYGKDLYTPGLDLGIMDTYPDEFLSIYEAVENPGENLQFLAEMAVFYGCEMIMLEDFEDEPESFGSFVLLERTQDYLIYGYQ